MVVNGDFGHVVRRLIPEAHRPRWRDPKVERARLSCSTFMMYLGIEGGVGPLAHHTILLARDYERNLREIAGGILPQEPSLYVQHGGATDGGLAPPGHTALYVLVPVPNLRAGLDWAALTPRYRALALERLKILGVADIERRIRYERIVTPTEWRDEFSVLRGRDLQPVARPAPDALFPPPQPLRGRRLPRRRRHPSRLGPAGDLRGRTHHRPSPRRRSGGEAIRRAAPAVLVALGRGSEPELAPAERRGWEEPA